MANAETQAEELEVLLSIYEGDPNFKHISNTIYQYIYGTEDERTTVLIEIGWPEDYPEKCPTFSLGSFYNNQLSLAAKDAFLNALDAEAAKNVGSQQTFTMIEWVRENYSDFMTKYLPENLPTSRMDAMTLEGNTDETAKTKSIKKEQLTKSQKRREWDRVDAKGEKPRGYDWIDVVKHLSQTGGSRQDVGDLPDSYFQSTNLPN